MKLALAAGVAAAGLAFSAIAHELPRMDADEDGFITRTEAAAAAERMFRELDDNNDGRLEAGDYGRSVLELRLDGGETDLMSREELREMHREILLAHREAAREAGAAAREAQREAHEAAREAHRELRQSLEGAEEDVRRVHVHRLRDIVIPPMPPMPPMPPEPPMFMMLIANLEEADANGDGALSLEEFRAQQLRYFDANDGNGDGRVRYTPPPEPPQPPEPPEPPEFDW